MPAPTKGPRLGGNPAHQRLMLANLATQLFENDRITTTEAKAKRLRPYVERLITTAKKGDLAAIRRISRKITDKGVANKLVTEVAPTMGKRNGGYTRIIKIGFRKGDSAPMAVIELVKEPVAMKNSGGKKSSDKLKPKNKENNGISKSSSASKVSEGKKDIEASSLSEEEETGPEVKK